MKLCTSVLLVLALAGCVVTAPEGPSGKAGGNTVVLCHKGKQTMELPEEAAQGHLNHGDHLGPC